MTDVGSAASTPSRHVDEIASRYSLGSNPMLVGTATRGELGQIWRLETVAGTWALKELLDRESEDEVGASAEFQEAAVAAGVPAPAVVRTVDNRVLLELEGTQFRVYSWAEIRPIDLNLDPVKVGTLLASIHRLHHPSVGPARPWYTQPVGPARWDQVIRELTTARAPHAMLAELRDELCALEALLEEPGSLQQLHLDLWADNVRATAAGELCVLDWENSGPGDPSQELATVLFEFGSGNQVRARSLYDAYVDAGGFGRITRRQNFSMAIAQLGHIVEWQCHNWLAATSPEQRQRAEDAIDEFVSRPLTRAVIEEILDAVA